MKKIIIFILFIVIILNFINIPNYVELNHLVIIEGIGMECNNDKYIITLKEIVPIKDDNGIKYDYKYYSIDTRELNKSKKIFEDKINNKLYFNSTKYIITNCSNSTDLIDLYNINPKYIKHINKDIIKELRKS